MCLQFKSLKTWQSGLKRPWDPTVTILRVLEMKAAEWNSTFFLAALNFPIMKLKTSPLSKSRIQWIITSRTQRSLQHVRPCSPLMLLPQVWGRIRRLWSSNREETRYLATTAVVSRSRCTPAKTVAPCEPSGCCAIWKLVIPVWKESSGWACVHRGSCWAGLRQGVMSPNGSPCSHFGSLIMLNCPSLPHAAVSVLEFSWSRLLIVHLNVHRQTSPGLEIKWTSRLYAPAHLLFIYEIKHFK